MGSNRVAPAYKALVDRELPSLEHALTARDAVHALQTQPGWDLLQGIVQAEIDSALTGLDRGGEPPSQAEYARAHGRRAGLLYMRELAEAIVARADQRYEEQKARHEGAGESVPEGVAA